MVIVDTFNVLHAAREAGASGLDLARLRGWLERCRWSSQHIVLVLDGPGRGDTLRRGLDAGLDLESRAGGISEVYSAAGGEGRGGHDADTVIEALLEREEQMGRGRQAVVVSSDKRVRAAATAARAKCIESVEFVRKLIEDQRKQARREDDEAGGRPEFAQDGGMDRGRTEYWLGEFGLGEKPRGSGGSGGRGQESSPEIDEADLDTGKWLKGPIGRAEEDDDGGTSDERGRGRRRR